MRRFPLRSLILLTLLLLDAELAVGSPQIELTTQNTTYSGKPIFHNQQFCWLTDADGKYERVLFKDVTASKKLPQPFHHRSAVTLKNDLKVEFGSSFEIVIRGPFVVAGPVGRVNLYADVLEQMSRNFARYLSVRRLPVSRMEFPLVVIIFVNPAEFQAYARAEEMPGGSTLKGYYHPLTNRVVLIEENPVQPGGNAGASSSLKRATDRSLSPQTVSTLIHEGIHQLAFNQGLHSRIGHNPRWIVEGLATMLEAHADLNQSTEAKQSNINKNRLQWFKRYQKNSRTETLAEFIANDEHYFRQNVLNGYSQAWAVTYYLAEEYPENYARYLKLLAQRDPADPDYTATERLEDFQAVFGKDLPWLEVKFLRFIQNLEATN